MFDKVQKENVPSITVGIHLRIHYDLLVYMNFACETERHRRLDGRALYGNHQHSSGLF